MCTSHLTCGGRATTTITNILAIWTALISPKPSFSQKNSTRKWKCLPKSSSEFLGNQSYSSLSRYKSYGSSAYSTTASKNMEFSAHRWLKSYWVLWYLCGCSIGWVCLDGECTYLSILHKLWEILCFTCSILWICRTVRGSNSGISQRQHWKAALISRCLKSSVLSPTASSTTTSIISTPISPPTTSTNAIRNSTTKMREGHTGTSTVLTEWTYGLLSAACSTWCWMKRTRLCCHSAIRHSDVHLLFNWHSWI